MLYANIERKVRLFARRTKKTITAPPNDKRLDLREFCSDSGLERGVVDQWRHLADLGDSVDLTCTHSVVKSI